MTLLNLLRAELCGYLGAAQADERARNLCQALQSERYPAEAGATCYELLEGALPERLLSRAARECWLLWLTWDAPSNWVRFQRLLGAARMSAPEAQAWLRRRGHVLGGEE